MCLVDEVADVRDSRMVLHTTKSHLVHVLLIFGSYFPRLWPKRHGANLYELFVIELHQTYLLYYFGQNIFSKYLILMKYV